ncbi:MAG: cadherin-like domain-containing protein, partial [Thermoplasmata archaeon]|nr:cadherin-like domain-containing protein [Thermoplasmata archaeon]
VTSATDIESAGLQYHYRWYRNGVLEPNATGESLSAYFTSKGQNWSVEVRASDGEDEGPAALAWRVIENAAPRTKNHLVDPVMDEDSVDSDWIDLSTAFEDPDGDPLTWTVESTPQHIGVEIDPTTGRVTLTPEENWNGEENITFKASDGEGTSSQTVTVYVTAVNDFPRFATVNGNPVGDGPVEITIKQGELLSIDVLVIDPEGNELVFDVNTTLFEVGGSTGSISWQPENDQVGTLRFGMTVWDVVTPSEKVTLDFIVVVENENDPMDDPRITTPISGTSFEEDILFSLIAICTDPDTIYGQILNFSWSSNMSGHLGYGPSLNIALNDVGTHVITLTVTDGDHQKMTTVNVIITEKADVT